MSPAVILTPRCSDPTNCAAADCSTPDAPGESLAGQEIPADYLGCTSRWGEQNDLVWTVLARDRHVSARLGQIDKDDFPELILRSL